MSSASNIIVSLPRSKFKAFFVVPTSDSDISVLDIMNAAESDPDEFQKKLGLDYVSTTNDVIGKDEPQMIGDMYNLSNENGRDLDVQRIPQKLDLEVKEHNLLEVFTETFELRHLVKKPEQEEKNNALPNVTDDFHYLRLGDIMHSAKLTVDKDGVKGEATTTVKCLGVTKGVHLFGEEEPQPAPPQEPIVFRGDRPMLIGVAGPGGELLFLGANFRAS